MLRDRVGGTALHPRHICVAPCRGGVTSAGAYAGPLPASTHPQADELCKLSGMAAWRESALWPTSTACRRARFGLLRLVDLLRQLRNLRALLAQLALRLLPELRDGGIKVESDGRDLAVEASVGLHNTELVRRPQRSSMPGGADSPMAIGSCNGPTGMTSSPLSSGAVGYALALLRRSHPHSPRYHHTSETPNAYCLRPPGRPGARCRRGRQPSPRLQP